MEMNYIHNTNEKMKKKEKEMARMIISFSSKEGRFVY
jgi:hypothetical protein